MTRLNNNLNTITKIRIEVVPLSVLSEIKYESMKWGKSRKDKALYAYFDFNVSNFVHSPNDGSAHHWREDVCWEIAAGISALHKLQTNKYPNAINSSWG